MPDDKIGQIVADPDFQSLGLADQQNFLSKVDPDFGQLDTGQFTTFLARYKGQQAQQPSQLRPNPIQPAMAAAAMATGLSADTRSPAAKAWDQIKAGLTSAQPGGGLKPQPTALGNAAEFVGMGASTAANLLGPPEGGGVVGQVIDKALPSTERAAATLGNLERADVIGNHTVDVAKAGDSALKAMRLNELTKATIPAPIRGFLQRVTASDNGPLTFAEGRDIYKAASKLSAADLTRLTGPMKAIISEFTANLGQALNETAARAGRLEQYVGALKEYAGAAKNADQVEQLKKILPKLGERALEGAGFSGGGYALLRALGLNPAEWVRNK